MAAYPIETPFNSFELPFASIILVSCFQEERTHANTFSSKCLLIWSSNKEILFKLRCMLSSEINHSLKPFFKEAWIVRHKLFHHLFDHHTAPEYGLRKKDNLRLVFTFNFLITYPGPKPIKKFSVE